MCGMLSEDYKIFNYSVNFVGPLSADSPFCIVIQPLRKGKNVTHIRADIVQNTQTCVSTLACFGLPRTSSVKVSSHQKSASIENAQPVLQTTNNPAFFQHFDLEIEHGDMPFSGSSSATYLGFMRFAKRPAAIGYAHLITMIDAWPPAVLQMLQQPAPDSNIDIHIMQLSYVLALDNVNPEVYPSYNNLKPSLHEKLSLVRADLEDALDITNLQCISVMSLFNPSSFMLY